MAKITKEQVLALSEQTGVVRTADLVGTYDVSRQYLNLLIRLLVRDKKLIKVGSTRSAYYVTPTYARTHPELLPQEFRHFYTNKHLEEHKVLNEIETKLVALEGLSEQVRDIFTYAFSEMFNNAIEHSRSKEVQVVVTTQGTTLHFEIRDTGVGVFRNIMTTRNLITELEAIQDLLKGKMTTMPKSHSGEGIFFTSRASDVFSLDSYGYELIVDNTLPDVFVRENNIYTKGTCVSFDIALNSARHLSDVFKQYTNLTDESDYGFDKTEIRVKLYAMVGVHISRSQARRILQGLDKFKTVIFDYDQVPMVGQAFADEIYRVFHARYPKIMLQDVHANEAVQFMINRAKTEAQIGR